MDRQIKTGQIKRPPVSVCVCCGKEKSDRMFVKTASPTYAAIGRIPVCRDCITVMFKKACNDFSYMDDPGKEATRYLCAVLDMYYKSEYYAAALKAAKGKDGFSTPEGTIAQYLKLIERHLCRGLSYIDAFIEGNRAGMPERTVADATTPELKKFFGYGFADEDYAFLSEQYKDWTDRHECKTKTQEENFKQICFLQLEIYKGRLSGQDVTGLVTTMQKLLDNMNLQPRQNAQDTLGESQSFGVLLEKWEREEPLPEIAEEFRDVDHIGLNMDVFYRGHMAKFLNIQNAQSAVYDRYMDKYSVHKPDYADGEDTEALFDAMMRNVLEREDLNEQQ